MLNADRWHRTKALYHAALELPEPDRRERLEAECPDDPEVLAAALDLLAADAHGASSVDGELASLAAATLDPPAPLRRAIGRYRILDVLGEGGMGVVYLGERDDLHHRAAIKVLRDATLSPARRERFLREEQTLARLAHPAIARLHDADVLPDGTPYFVMEHVEGMPLAAYCDAHARTARACVQLLRDVCAAVQYAHEEGVVHRDLKPSNILVARDGAVKLLDFGIATRLEALDAPAAPDTPEGRTQTVLRMMTLAYAAPEQVRGERGGPYTDVHALGLILYELLTGERPYDRAGLTTGQVETRILEHEPERPSAAARRAPRGSPAAERAQSLGRAAWSELDVLCLTALQKDPRRRYRTAQALLRDLDHFLDGKPLDARPDTLAYRARTFLRRRWRPVAVAAAVLAVVVGQLAFYTARLTTARDAALAAAARARRIQRFTLRLFQGDGGVSVPESLRAVALIDRGVREARLLDREPAVQAELFQTLGAMYQDVGNLGRADSLMRVALARRRALLPPDDPDVARSLVALALVRDDEGAYEEAERLVREGLAVVRRSRWPTGSVAVGGEVALGKVLLERSRYDSAIAVLEQAARHGAALGADSVDPTEALNQLANAHYYRGHLATSDSINRIVLAIDRARLGPRHPDVADALINLAASRYQAGDYAEAERLHREALSIFTDYYGPDHPETASSEVMLAQTLTASGRPAEAVALLRAALAVRERVYGPTHPRIATTLNELGTAAQKQGDLAAAVAYFARAADVYRAAYGKHVFIGVALSNLAVAYAEQGRLALAERTFHDALAEVTRAAPGHAQLGIVRAKYGRALLHARRYAEARAQLLAAHASLAAQPTPPPVFLRRTFEDLVAVDSALGDRAGEARYRAALAKLDAGAPPR